MMKPSSAVAAQQKKSIIVLAACVKSRGVAATSGLAYWTSITAYFLPE